MGFGNPAPGNRAWAPGETQLRGIIRQGWNNVPMYAGRPSAIFRLPELKLGFFYGAVMESQILLN
ncbi:MAG: hypothetical protein E7022_03355 [Desulfovibrio desulfuricans]|jgi:hypothetical protein|nr:hypothetical protein [Desulfovibrio desulfuricans]